MNTLFDKIWDAHVVQKIEDGPTQLYIDRLYCHEVTSPQAFDGLRARGLKCFRPGQIFCMPDHNTPTHDQDKPIEDPVSRKQVDTLARNAEEFGLTHFGMLNPRNGIIHVVGPERGLTLPGMTIVCGDSHTSTHGAMGAIAFGIGTSEVEMVLATQCILQSRPKTMRITIDGTLGKGVTAKDMALYLMSKITTSGATGYFIEYAGEAVRNLSMEGRLTLCNLSIEMGARGGMIAPDETTFAYIKGREYAPQGEAWDKAVAYWKTLKSDDDATFDKELRYAAADIEPMITYGTNPGMGTAITAHIPTTEGMSEVEKSSFEKSMQYMGFEPGEPLLGKKADYVFLKQPVKARALRPRTDKAHVALEDVPDLRQLIQPRPAQKRTKARTAPIIRVRPARSVPLGVLAHGAKLIHSKRLAVLAQALLPKDRIARRVERDDQRDDRHRQCQHSQAHQRTGNVERALERKIRPLFGDTRPLYIHHALRGAIFHARIGNHSLHHSRPISFSSQLYPRRPKQAHFTPPKTEHRVDCPCWCWQTTPVKL